MRIAFVTTFEILGPPVTGAIQCAVRNLSLLKQAFGDENIFVCAITRYKEFLSKTTPNTKVFYANRNQKRTTLRNGIAVLLGRQRFDKKTEDAVIKYIIQLDCDAAFIDYSLMGFLPAKLPKRIKQALFMHNIEYDVSKLRPYPRIVNYIVSLATYYNESISVKNADIIISLTNRDAARLKKYYKRHSEMILPITFDDRYSEGLMDPQLPASAPFTLLFVGSYFSANNEGLTWFIDNVMPFIKAKLTVVGKDMEKLTNKLKRDNVEIIGTVDELSHFYYNADAVISPLFSGSGMKVKTAEALMYGKPMFATDEALEGYEVDDLENVYRCNTSEQFISAITDYIANEQRTDFDRKVRNRFLEKYHTPSYVPAFRELFIE